MAFTAWSTASMRAMQLASSSVGASFFWPIRRRAVDRVEVAGFSHQALLSVASKNNTDYTEEGTDCTEKAIMHEWALMSHIFASNLRAFSA